jgi:hypothetical protein
MKGAPKTEWRQDEFTNNFITQKIILEQGLKIPFEIKNLATLEWTSKRKSCKRLGTRYPFNYKVLH